MRDMARVGLVPRPTVSRGGHKVVVLFTLCLGVLTAQVDSSVVNLAIQSIGSSFVAPVTALQWVLDAYNLTYAALLLTGGLIADLYGRRLAFQLGAATIEVVAVIASQRRRWRNKLSGTSATVPARRSTRKNNGKATTDRTSAMIDDPPA